MMVRVLLFAAAREVAGANEVKVQMPSCAKFSELRVALGAKYPQLAPVAMRAHFAANERYVSDGDLIPGDAEIALIPPVSGG
jgi:molybdopterin converting factor subunit 1